MFQADRGRQMGGVAPLHYHPSSSSHATCALHQVVVLVHAGALATDWSDCVPQRGCRHVGTLAHRNPRDDPTRGTQLATILVKSDSFSSYFVSLRDLKYVTCLFANKHSKTYKQKHQRAYNTRTGTRQNRNEK